MGFLKMVCASEKTIFHVSSWATCAQQSEMILAPSSGQILHKQAIYWLLVFFLNILYEDNLLCYVDDLKKIVYIY